MGKLTNKHRAYDLALRDHDLLPVLAIGYAGTGKTFGACRAAVEWLRSGKKQKVIGIRPNVPFGEDNGFLPGTEAEKNAPWVRPIAQNLAANGLNMNEQDCAIKNGNLAFYPLSLIQGLTFDNAFVILDEVENMTFQQIKGFMTRIGKWTKVVMCGDIDQVSPKFKDSGLAEYIEMINHFDARMHIIDFNSENDILRGDICKENIIMFNEWENMK